MRFSVLPFVVACTALGTAEVLSFSLEGADVAPGASGGDVTPTVVVAQNVAADATPSVVVAPSPDIAVSVSPPALSLVFSSDTPAPDGTPAAFPKAAVVVESNGVNSEDFGNMIKIFRSQGLGEGRDMNEIALAYQARGVPDECIPWPVGSNFDAMVCFTKLFFSGENSFAKWILQGMGQAGSFKTLAVDIIKRCGAKKIDDVIGNFPGVSWIKDKLNFDKPGPFDALICDMIDAMRTGDMKEIDMLGIKECGNDSTGEPMGKACAEKFMGTGSKTEMMKTLLSVVSGWNFGGDPEGTNIFTNVKGRYDDCRGNGKDFMGCLGFALTQVTCEGLCETASCQINLFEDSGSAECKKAVKSGCGPLFAAANTLCTEMLGGMNPETKTLMNADEFEFNLCPSECKSASSLLTTSFAFLLVALQLWT